MMISERVAAFLRQHRGQQYCDDCIAESLGLSQRQQAFRVTSALAVTAEFQRQDGECVACHEKPRKVIRAKTVGPTTAEAIAELEAEAIRLDETALHIRQQSAKLRKAGGEPTLDDRENLGSLARRLGDIEQRLIALWSQPDSTQEG